MQQPQQPQQINVELGEKEAEGIYSNLAMITHSQQSLSSIILECYREFQKQKSMPALS